MDWLNPQSGVLFCSRECAREHHEIGPHDRLVPVGPESFDAAQFGIYCPVCLQPYEGFLRSDCGQISTDFASDVAKLLDEGDE